MSSAISLTGYKRLHNILISLEMEISDSILTALSEEVAVCRQEQKKQLIFVDPMLICIETVIRHIDEIDAIRALPDAHAFDLLNELVRAYQLITEELIGQQEACQEVVSASLQKVFAWQHACIQDGMHRAQEAVAAPSVRIDALAFDVQDLLTTVQQEITTTGMMVIRESATLLELVYTQHKRDKKDKRAGQGAATRTDSKTGTVFGFQGMNEVKQVEKVEQTGETGEGKKDVFTSLIEENISSLQQIFQQELERLRHDIIRE